MVNRAQEAASAVKSKNQPAASGKGREERSKNIAPKLIICGALLLIGCASVRELPILPESCREAAPSAGVYLVDDLIVFRVHARELPGLVRCLDVPQPEPEATEQKRYGQTQK